MFKSITTNIMVESVQETILFYQKKLGFEVLLTVPEEGTELDFAMLKKDDISMMLQSKKSMESEYETLKCDVIKPCFTLFITVDNVDEVYHQLNGTVSIAKELHQTFYGKPEFAIFDNNDNILTISC